MVHSLGGSSQRLAHSQLTGANTRVAGARLSRAETNARGESLQCAVGGETPVATSCVLTSTIAATVVAAAAELAATRPGLDLAEKLSWPWCMCPVDVAVYHQPAHPTDYPLHHLHQMWCQCGGEMGGRYKGIVLKALGIDCRGPARGIFVFSARGSGIWPPRPESFLTRPLENRVDNHKPRQRNL